MSKYQALIDALNGDNSLFSNVRNGDLRALLADLERAEKDAGRYRFLAAHYDSEDDFDAAIDAALAQMAGG